MERSLGPSGKSPIALPRDFHGLYYLNDSGIHGGQWPPLPPTRIPPLHDSSSPLQAAEANSMRNMSYDRILPLGFQPSPYNLASQTFFGQCLNTNGLDAKSFRSPMHLHHGRAKRCQMTEQLFRSSVPAPSPAAAASLIPQQQSVQRDAGGKIASVHDSSPGSFLQCNPAKQQAPPAQLTIFYRGAVLVYNDVSLDQAKEIMQVADNRPKLISSSFVKSGLVTSAIDPMYIKDPIPTDASEIPQQNRETSNCSGDPVSLTLTIGSHATSHEDMAMLNSSRPCSAAPLKLVDGTVDSSCSSASMPRAIPQARRASIARFLEKRKDRLIDCMPFCYNSKKSS